MVKDPIEAVPLAAGETAPTAEDPLAATSQALLGFGHPIRIRALALLEFETTPGDMATVLGAPLGVVSYHVRMLRDYGLAEQTRTEPRRGALQHFYIRTELADDLMAVLASRLDLPKRGPGKVNPEKRIAALQAWALK